MMRMIKSLNDPLNRPIAGIWTLLMTPHSEALVMQFFISLIFFGREQEEEKGRRREEKLHWLIPFWMDERELVNLNLLYTWCALLNLASLYLNWFKGGGIPAQWSINSMSHKASQCAPDRDSERERDEWHHNNIMAQYKYKPQWVHKRERNV